eukprot:3415933-Pleurochrysis_carterae.AAC.1
MDIDCCGSRQHSLGYMMMTPWQISARAVCVEGGNNCATRLESPRRVHAVAGAPSTVHTPHSEAAQGDDASAGCLHRHCKTMFRVREAHETLKCVC